jgi:hypothetical protein
MIGLARPSAVSYEPCFPAGRARRRECIMRGETPR